MKLMIISVIADQRLLWEFGAPVTALFQVDRTMSNKAREQAPGTAQQFTLTEHVTIDLQRKPYLQAYWTMSRYNYYYCSAWTCMHDFNVHRRHAHNARKLSKSWYQLISRSSQLFICSACHLKSWFLLSIGRKEEREGETIWSEGWPHYAPPKPLIISFYPNQRAWTKWGRIANLYEFRHAS